MRQLRIEKQQPPWEQAAAESTLPAARRNPFFFNPQSAIRNPQSRGNK
jgi:hypothetical protein